MLQEQVQMGARVTINDPYQPWHGAAATIHTQNPQQVSQGICIVALERPLSIQGQFVQALSLPIASLVPEAIITRVTEDGGGVPLRLTLTFNVEYSVNPKFYQTTDPRAVLAEEIKAARKDPKFVLSQPAAVFSVSGVVVGLEEPKPAPAVVPLAELPPAEPPEPPPSSPKCSDAIEASV